jgi:hypothetical protein
MSLLIICFLSFQQLNAQESKWEKAYHHEVKLGSGIGTSAFTGISVMAGYQYHEAKNFLGLQYNALMEFVLFGGSVQMVSDLSLTANRELLSRLVKISVGAGIARVWHTINWDEPDEARFSQWGLPLELNIIIGRNRLKAGLSIHYNSNAYNDFCNFNSALLFSF